ncbi:MAG: N-acetylmuramoyl-L-alanine amidase [bacterium]|nr:N-acetylmuramoyl-L-alanine amidase [bacterium]
MRSKYSSLSFVVFTVLSVVPTIHAQFGPDLCIDPGHGCSNPLNPDSCKPGNLTYISGFQEKDINLNVALALKDTLEQHGFSTGMHIVYTRLSDLHMELQERADFANSLEADAFISIHHNASTTLTTYQGSETWYSNNATVTCVGGYYGQDRSASDTLARKVVSRLVKEFGYRNRGHKEADFEVLKCSKMVSTLTEASFINDGFFDNEADLFHNPLLDHTEEEAKAIYDGWRSHVTGQGFGNIRYEYQNMGLNDILQVAVTLGDQFGDDYDS